MTEPKKFRFPIIELLSLSVIILGAVIVLWPAGDKYVYKLVTGKEPNDGGELVEDTLTNTRPNLVYAPGSNKSITQKIAAEIRSLPGMANNKFLPHAQISGEIQGVISSDNSFETPDPVELNDLNEPNEPPAALPADSIVDDSTLNEPLSFDESIDSASQHLVPELPAPDADNQFMAPAIDSITETQFEEDQFVELGLPEAQDDSENFSADTELTSPLDAAPEQAPSNQINHELDSDYTLDSVPDLTPPASVVETSEMTIESIQLQSDMTRNDMPKVRQLPVWEPQPMRVVNGSLTPMTTPQPSPSGWHKEISDEGAVVWKSDVAVQQELPANELAPTVKQVVAPRIQTARLPQLPRPQPLFTGGIVPEHVPGAKQKMMSETMQSENDFELPASSSTEYDFSSLPIQEQKQEEEQKQEQQQPVPAGGQLPTNPTAEPASVFQRQNPLR